MRTCVPLPAARLPSTAFYFLTALRSFMVADSVDVGRSPVGGIGMDGLGVWTEFLVKVTGNEDKSIAENHWLRLTPSVALLRGQVRSSLGIRCQQQQLVD